MNGIDDSIEFSELVEVKLYIFDKVEMSLNFFVLSKPLESKNLLLIYFESFLIS